MRAKAKVCLRGAAIAASIVTALSSSVPAAAQTLVDAGRVEFSPSADHDATAGGVAVLTSYELQIVAADTGQTVRSISLGKPSPQSDGFIRLDFLRLLPAPLAPAIDYQARVAAVGPGGSAASALSNRFSYTPTCPPTLTSASASAPAAGSTGSVTVNAASGCAWSAASPAGWITITSGASGSGTATVAFRVAANTASTSRSATLTIAGRSFAVSQAAAAASACTYSISSASRTAPAGGETATVTVSTASGCSWSATSSTRWLGINGSATRAGAGSVGIVVAANPGSAQRTGTVTLAGRTFTVTQPGGCSFAVSPRTIAAAAAGSTGTIAVTTGAGCRWSTSGMPSWLSIPSAARTGSGQLSYTVRTNTSTSARTASLLVGGLSVAVSQAGARPPVPPSGLRVTGSGR